MLGLEYTIIFIVYAVLKLTTLKLSENNEKILLITLAATALIYKLALVIGFGVGSDYSPYLFVEYKNYDALFVSIITNCAFITYLLHNYVYGKKIENTVLIFALISAPNNLAMAFGLLIVSWFLPQDKQTKAWTSLLFAFVLSMSVFNISNYSFYLSLFGLGYLVLMAITKQDQEKKNLVFSLLFIYSTTGHVDLNVFQLIVYALPALYFAYRSFFIERINDYWLKCFYVCLFSYALMQDQSSGLKSFLLFLALGILLLAKEDWAQFKISKLGNRENLLLAILISSFVIGATSPLVTPFIFGSEISIYSVLLIILLALIYSRYMKALEDNLTKAPETDVYKSVLASLVLFGSLVHFVLVLVEYDLENTWLHSLGLIAVFGIVSFACYKMALHFNTSFERLYIHVNSGDKYNFKTLAKVDIENKKQNKTQVSTMDWPEMTNVSKSALLYGLLVAIICAIVVVG